MIKKSEAFTLIEILIVIGIISVLFLITLNFLNGFNGISKEKMVENAVYGLRQEQKILAESGVRVEGKKKCYGVKVEDGKLFGGVFDYFEVLEGKVDFCDVKGEGWKEVELGVEVLIDDFEEVYVGR